MKLDPVLGLTRVIRCAKLFGLPPPPPPPQEFCSGEKYHHKIQLVICSRSLKVFFFFCSDINHDDMSQYQSNLYPTFGGLRADLDL